MLVLSRREGESITLNTDIVITVQRIKGNQVRLSIEAPTSVPVVRTEILQKLGRDEEAHAE